MGFWGLSPPRFDLKEDIKLIKIWDQYQKSLDPDTEIILNNDNNINNNNNNNQNQPIKKFTQIENEIDALINEQDESDEDSDIEEQVDEIEIYLKEYFSKQLINEYNDNPLAYWTQPKTIKTFPVLSRLSIFILSVQQSEAPSECLFSISNIIVDEKRTSLSNHKVSLLTFLVSRWKLNQSNKRKGR